MKTMLTFTKEEVVDIILEYLFKKGYEPTGKFNIYCEGNYLKYIGIEVKE